MQAYRVQLRTTDGDRLSLVRAADVAEALTIVSDLCDIVWPGAVAVSVDPLTPEAADQFAADNQLVRSAG